MVATSAPGRIAYLRDDFVPFRKANLSIASAPVLYGLAVYTTFPVFWHEKEQRLYMFRLEDHFKRLQSSSKILAFLGFIEDWNYQRFESVIRELLQRNNVKKDSLVRVSVFVDEMLKGTRMHDLKNSLSIFVYPATPLLPLNGAKLCVSSWQRTPDNAVPPRAKINGSYVNAALMKHEAVLNGYDDAISLDHQGHVCESSVANIFLTRNSRLITPSGSSDLMEGITRDTIFKLAEGIGVVCEQRTIDRSELYLADEIFLSGTSVQIAPVIEVDRRKVGSGHAGKLTGAITKAYRDATNGLDLAHKYWLTAV